MLPSFDLDRANAILDEAGYEDTDGDGIREMPDGGEPLNFRYMVRSDSVNAQPIAEFFTGWLKEIGIGTTRKVVDDSQLTEIIGKGDYDMFFWGWTPFVDPDTMLSYFTCDQIASDPENPTDYYNDANYCDPGYDKLYEQQKVELDDQKRVDIVHEMLERQAKWGVYHTLYTEPDTQAYVKDRFEGWVKQPAETGPVLYSNTSPTYARLKPVSATASGGDDGGGAAAPSSRSRSSLCSPSAWGRSCSDAGARLTTGSEREVRHKQGPRVARDPVLRHLLQLLPVPDRREDPVANLFRGRNLTDSQRAELTHQFGLDKSTCGQFVDYLQQTAQLNLGRSYQTNQPVWDEIMDAAGPTIALVGVVGDPVGRLRRDARHRGRLAKTHEDRLHGHRLHDDHLLDARLLARDAAARRVRGRARLVPDRRHRRTRRRRPRASRSSPTRRSTCSCRRSR